MAWKCHACGHAWYVVPGITPVACVRCGDRTALRDLDERPPAYDAMPLTYLGGHGAVYCGVRCCEESGDAVSEVLDGYGYTWTRHEDGVTTPDYGSCCDWCDNPLPAYDYAITHGLDAPHGEETDG